MYIQASSMDDLDQKLKVAAKEAMQFGCTWSISKFFAARPCNIVSGFRVVLDQGCTTGMARYGGGHPNNFQILLKATFK